jgi:adenylate cyclase class 2
MIEVEGKILDIDPEVEIAKLISLGYLQVSDEILVAKFFENTEGIRVRLRSEKGVWVLNSKTKIHEDGASVKARIEHETVVSDPEAMAKILETAGFRLDRTVTKRRRSFHREGGTGHVEIDEYGNIPPLLEIEAGSPEEVLAIAAELGFPPERLTNDTTWTLEKRYGVRFGT